MSTVLIVDDEAQNVNALKRELQDRNPSWIIHTAKNEFDAIALMSQHSPDAIISDLVMTTDKGGMEVLREAKARDPLIMVILITAYEKRLDRYRAFELGAFDCVQKNTPGVIAAEEISIKTQAALRFRELALQQIETQKRLAFLKRYFDPRVFGMLEESPELLNIKNQTVTICFWDIRGFSRLCESLKAHPSLIAAFLQEYFKLSAQVIFAHHGVLDKYIGDGVMGIFGSLNHKDDEGREYAKFAVSAALDLRSRFDDLLKEWKDRWNLYTPQAIDIGLGCGIHTGDVLVGNVGTDVRDQYTALGPDVNLAQRIEAHAGKREIIISASTQTRVKDHFELASPTILENVKNIAGEFQVYSVLGRKG